MFVLEYLNEASIVVSLALYADDTAMLALDVNPVAAFNLFEDQLDLTEQWFEKWTLRVNAADVALTMRRENCPSVLT